MSNFIIAICFIALVVVQLLQYIDMKEIRMFNSEQEQRYNLERERDRQERREFMRSKECQK